VLPPLTQFDDLPDEGFDAPLNESREIAPEVHDSISVLIEDTMPAQDGLIAPYSGEVEPLGFVDPVMPELMHDSLHLEPSVVPFENPLPASFD